MIVKPSVQFLDTDSDAKLITRVGGIVTSMTGNASYTTPEPSMPDMAASLGAFQTAVSNAEGGGVTLTAIKREKRTALVALTRQLASYVQVACNGDMAVLVSSGFPIQKPQRQPVGVLAAPSKLTVSYGPRSGELRAVAAPVAGAAVYNWQISTEATPNVVLQSVQTTAARNTFANLTPGVVYRVVVNAVGSAGPSNWSDPVPQMAV